MALHKFVCMDMEVRIFTAEDSPRLRFIASLLLGEILGLPWMITSDRRKIRNRPVINYSNKKIDGTFHIVPEGLLSETCISPREIMVTQWKGLPVFFNSQPDSDFPFDIFAASFYLLSRYEEYGDDRIDEHGRYMASSSLAFRNGFLQVPVVDLWVMEFAKAFIRKFRNITIKRNEFRSLLTFDADQPFAFVGKNILESIGGIVGELRSNSLNIRRRYRTITHSEKDPYDVFDFLTRLAGEYKVETRFFFPVGAHSKRDKNPSWKNPDYRELIRDLSGKHAFGLHPSYEAAFNPSLFHSEKTHLCEIAGNNVICSRFHYLRFRLPESYRNIIKSGITEDYSMGYSDEPGFRSGIARPYFFYDLTEEKQTELRIYPFQIMDETLFQLKQLGNDAALQLINNIVSRVKSVGGMYISIWHNTSLLEDEAGIERRSVLGEMLKSLN